VRQYRQAMNARTPYLSGLILALLLALGGTAAAQEQEKKPLYDIELLIFRNLVNSDDGEAWPLNLTDYAFGDREDESLQDGTPVLASQPKTTRPADGSTHWLPADTWQLKNAEGAMKRSPNYRPLLHLAWRQAVPPRADGNPVELPQTQTGQAGEQAYVTGTATVSLGRYLHLALDLQLHPSLSDLEEAGLDIFEIPQFRLTESRRMRGKELHYFDHPRFGVLAIITPYKKTDGKPE